MTATKKGFKMSEEESMLRRFMNHAEIFGYPSKSFKVKVKKYLKQQTLKHNS